jgi:hypothetical protein
MENSFLYSKTISFLTGCTRPDPHREPAPPALSLCAPLLGGPRRLHGPMCQPPVFPLSHSPPRGARPSTPHGFSPISPRAPPLLWLVGPPTPIFNPRRAKDLRRAASGHPTPPRCRGRHLRAHRARFCAIADRFCAAPLPPPAGRYAVMPRPSSLPTSPVRTTTCRVPCRVCMCAGAVCRCTRRHVQLPRRRVSFTRGLVPLLRRAAVAWSPRPWNPIQLRSDTSVRIIRTVSR